MEHTRHNHLIGKAAERLAAKVCLDIVDPSYFSTEKRREQLKRAKEMGDAIVNDHDYEDNEEKNGNKNNKNGGNGEDEYVSDDDESPLKEPEPDLESEQSKYIDPEQEFINSMNNSFRSEKSSDNNLSLSDINNKLEMDCEQFLDNSEDDNSDQEIFISNLINKNLHSNSNNRKYPPYAARVFGEIDQNNFENNVINETEEYDSSEYDNKKNKNNMNRTFPLHVKSNKKIEHKNHNKNKEQISQKEKNDTSAQCSQKEKDNKILQEKDKDNKIVKDNNKDKEIIHKSPNLLEREREREKEKILEAFYPGSTGTVGCVCMYGGHVAAATSTGGLTNKMAGRVGTYVLLSC